MTGRMSDWKPIKEAPELIRKYGPNFAPGVGGEFLYQLMMTDDGPVILKFAQPRGGDAPVLEYWLLAGNAPQ